jgi:hypothetical protein
MAGQDRRARRRALGLDIVVLEAQSLAGQGIDAWRGRQAAVAADVPPTDVVAHDEDDIGCDRTLTFSYSYSPREFTVAHPCRILGLVAQH